jgi:hypothetical protein
MLDNLEPLDIFLIHLVYGTAGALIYAATNINEFAIDELQTLGRRCVENEYTSI